MSKNPKKEIINLYNSLENKRSMLNILRAAKYKYLIEYLNETFPMLVDKKYSIGMKIYWLINGIKNFPKCKECGRPNKTHRCYIDGYATDFCSKKCASGTLTHEKMKTTCLERYGVENPLQDENILQKVKNTCLERYGVENASKADFVIKKIEETKLERYGDRFYVNREKMEKTNLEKYGVKNIFEDDGFQKRAKESMVAKYGVASPMQIPEIHDKVANDTKERQVHYSYENFLKVNPYSEPVFTEAYYFEHRGKDEEYEFKCRKCGKVFLSRVHNGHIRRCPECYPSTSTSGLEQDLFDFLKSVYHGKIVRKDRTLLYPKELDFAIPEKKIAIEFDGLYWHSESNGIGKNYHLDKTLKCEKEGWQLIHVFEDEWCNRQEIVKSRISGLLGCGTKKIFARKCKLIDVPPKVEKEFLVKNHIQGPVSSSYCYGLEYNGELVSLMSFSKCRIALGRKGRDGVYELLRFCSKLGYRVVGAASRLLKHFENVVKPVELVSYADRRWSVGKVYNAIGFELDHISPPNYWYLKNGCDRREHRFVYRKNVLKDKLEFFDPKLSETENMKQNKFTRIWDCGNLVFVKKYNS